MPDIGRWHTGVVISNISCRSTGVADQLPRLVSAGWNVIKRAVSAPKIWFTFMFICLFFVCISLFVYCIFRLFIFCICLSRQEETYLTSLVITEDLVHFLSEAETQVRCIFNSSLISKIRLIRLLWTCKVWSKKWKSRSYEVLFEPNSGSFIFLGQRGFNLCHCCTTLEKQTCKELLIEVGYSTFLENKGYFNS